MILCTRISPGKTWLSLSKILLLWQHCRFQALFKDFKKCSVITSWHIIFKELCYQFVLDMNAMVKACTMPIFAYEKEQLKHYCFEQKRSGTNSVALATIFSA